MKKIVLLITGGAVSGALVEIPHTKGEMPHILRVTRESAPIGTPYESERFLADLPARISAVATTLRVTEAVSINVCLAAPLTLSQVHTIIEESPEPHTITPDEITQMVNTASSTFVQAHGSLLAHLVSGEPIALESLLIGSLLNGYAVDEPEGLSARTREFRIFTSLSSRVLIDTITNASMAAWPHHSSLSFSSFSYNASRAFAELFPEHDNAIVIHVGEHHSDVVMVWNDGIADASMVTLGVTEYLTEVGKALSLDSTQVISAVRLYAEGGATPESSVKIAEASRAVRDTWMKAFTLAAQAALEEFFLPDQVAIVSDEPGVTTALTRAFAQDLAYLSFSDSTFNFLPLGEELTKMLILPEKDIQHPALMLVCLFYARIV